MFDSLAKGITNFPVFAREYGLIRGSRRLIGLGYWRTFHDVSGRSIFNEEWDVCIILDACRADELEYQSDRFDWIEHVGRFPSLGSATWQWLPRTIEETPDELLDQTTYVTANPMSGEFCDDEQFHELDEVWRYAWDENRGTVLPRPITDRAIHHGREKDTERILVHYLQPHIPFLVEEATNESLNTVTYGGANESDTDWDRVARGELPLDTIISWYRETLRKVLDEVELLISNIDADKVVITADHGEAFGEWGLFGHPANVDLDVLANVPWVETSAVDNDIHEPKDYTEERGEASVTDLLRDLGYR